MANYTRDTPKEVQLPVRLPLVGVLNQRSDSGGIDSRLINGYVEKGQDGEIRVTKRQGYSLFPGIGPGTSSGGNGMASTSLGVLSVFGDGFYNGSGALFATHPSLGGMTHILEVSTSASGRAAFLNCGSACFFYNGSTFKQILPEGTARGPLTASITNGSSIVILASTAELSKYSDVTGTGIPANTTIASVDSSTQITLSQNATATNASAALSFVMAGPPVGLIARSQILNRSVYVMTSGGTIAGADPDDPLAWNPLNRIVAYATLTTATQFSRQLAYLFAFKEDGYEVFRDDGNSPGSPLARVEGMQGDIGSLAFNTLQEVDDRIIWISRSRTAAPSVWMLTGGKAREIATPAVKRILMAVLEGQVTTFAFPMEGHLFFGLHSTVSDFTLIYDITSDFWSQWKGAEGVYLPFSGAAVSIALSRPTSGGGSSVVFSQNALFQHESNGKVYQFQVENVTDDGSPFDMDIYPPEFDANMMTSKYLSKMYVSGDQQTGSILKVRVNDNNQQPGSWTNWREFDLSSARPRIDECGSFYKRSFHFRHSSATRCRIESVEMDLQPGTL